MPDDLSVSSQGVADPGEARGVLHDLVNQEPERHALVIALVAPLGTPLGEVEKAFRDSLQRFGYQTEPIHLSQLLDDCQYQPWDQLPERGQRNYYEARMDAGDQLRKDVGNGSALAALAVGVILERRASLPLETAFVLRSLKHPDEAKLLRQVYGDAFSLVAVASTLDERRDNLAKDLGGFDDPSAEAQALITRDEADDSQREYGQRVRDVYQMADVFVTTGHGVDPSQEVDRFTDSLFGAPFITPRMEEEAMRLAYDASLRSAAIGRQVGAALIPVLGTPVVIGTNEVAKPGGGQYWTGDIPDLRDFQTGHDPNPLYTSRVVQELLERLAKQGWLSDAYTGMGGSQLLGLAREPDASGNSVLQGARAAALIEFTRCMHAEQAAIINAARSGVSTDGAILCCTTFPCHECAKMILGAGIVEVLYIEPYPKSLVSRLYRDVIDTAPPLASTRGLVGGKVPFRPFVGIAPRRYERAFVAGRRGIGAALVDFNRADACPRTTGWTSGMTEREAVAVKAISDLLSDLAERGVAGEGRARRVPSRKADPPAAAEVRPKPGASTEAIAPASPVLRPPAGPPQTGTSAD